MMYHLYKLFKLTMTIILLFWDKTALARDRDFDPMSGMEVLTHGETEIASFPGEGICCSIKPTNGVVSYKEYYGEGPFAELHVTRIGAQLFPINSGDRGFTTTIHQKLNRPNTYPTYAFNIIDFSDGQCEDMQYPMRRAYVKERFSEIEDKDLVARHRATIDSHKKAGPIDVAFTFFGQGKNPRETAVMHCWPLEDEAMIIDRIKRETPR